MIQKKIPMRTCVVSKEKMPKRDLIRIVRNKEGMIFVDETGKQNGKGIYLKKDIEIIKKAKNNKILNRYLECEVPENIYDEILNIIK